MEKNARSVVDEIQKLSIQGQAAIVVEILDALDDEGAGIEDEEMLRELQRREAEGMEKFGLLDGPSRHVLSLTELRPESPHLPSRTDP